MLPILALLLASNWQTTASHDPMTDKTYQIFRLEGEYIPAQSETPQLEISCLKGKLRTLSVLSGGLTLDSIPLQNDPRERNGQYVEWRLGSEKSSKNFMTVHADYKAIIFMPSASGKALRADTLRVRLDFWPTGYGIAQFHPSIGLSAILSSCSL